MFENLKETAKFDYKDSYEMTDKIEEELVLHDSSQDLIEKIDYYLHEKGLREQIGYRAHLRTVREHTYEHRMVSMLERLENCCVI